MIKWFRSNRKYLVCVAFVNDLGGIFDEVTYEHGSLLTDKCSRIFMAKVRLRPDLFEGVDVPRDERTGISRARSLFEF